MLSENFFHFLKDLKRERNIEAGPMAILHENTLFGEDSARFQALYARRYGYRIIGSVGYQPKSTGLTLEIRKLRSLGVGTVLQTSYTADAVLSMRTYKALGFAPRAILANNAGFIDHEFLGSLGEDAEFVLSREVWAEDLAVKKPVVMAVADMFRKRTGKPMDGNSARAFTAIFVPADAINRAGSTDPALIQKALLETDLKPEALIMPWDGMMVDAKTPEHGG